jgi:hypothetical protein
VKICIKQKDKKNHILLIIADLIQLILILMLFVRAHEFLEFSAETSHFLLQQSSFSSKGLHTIDDCKVLSGRGNRGIGVEAMAFGSVGVVIFDNMNARKRSTWESDQTESDEV